MRLLKYLVEGVNTIGEGHWQVVLGSYNFPKGMTHRHLSNKWRSLRIKRQVTFKDWEWILTL